MLTPDEVAAMVWDDYLHRFGAEAYVVARYEVPHVSNGSVLGPYRSASLSIPTGTARSVRSSRNLRLWGQTSRIDCMELLENG
jgi:hypothetical protein